MGRIALALASLACCATAFAQSPEAAPILQELVVVGRLIDIAPVPSDCPDAAVSALNGIVCGSFDEVFRARYEVLEVVAGTPASRDVTFTVADHYGSPEFTHYETALLFLERDDDGWYLHRYHGFQVQRTNDGDWATCGRPFANSPPVPAPLSFAQDLGGPHGQRLPEDDADDYWQHSPALQPYIAIEGRRVRCLQGVRLRALYDAVRGE